MKTIAIYGNIVIDNVFQTDTIDIDSHAIQCHDYQKIIGGIANVARTLALNDNNHVLCFSTANTNDFSFLMHEAEKARFKLYLKSSYMPTTTATILVNKNSSSKRSLVYWNTQDEPDVFSLAQWHHIAYLDSVNISEDFLRSCRRFGIVSADLCIGKYSDKDRERLLDLMKNIDYVFMSDHEACSFFKDIYYNVGRRATIVHRACGSDIYVNGEERVSMNVKVRKGINVLGAGDKFAAYCINHLLSNDDLYFAVLSAHINTGNSL